MIKYSEKHTVACYDTDVAGRMKPVAFMNLAQEAAGRHAVYLGFGYDDLIVSNTAWILSRVHVEFVDTPRWREEIVLNTWHKGLNRLFFLRDFVITDNAGNEKVKATTSWLVMDLESRKLVRDPGLIEEGTVCTENAVESPADKVQMPKDIDPETVMEHVVAYSDVDTNGHANNAMYMHWAMDAVDYKTASEMAVKCFTINFNHEAKPGDKIVISRACMEKEDGLHVYLEGRCEDASTFCAEIVFVPDTK